MTEICKIRKTESRCAFLSLIGRALFRKTYTFLLPLLMCKIEVRNTVIFSYNAPSDRL